MGNKAVFLDRDGTINAEKNYLYRIEDFEYIPGVKVALKKLQEAGYLLIVVTNQSGIGRGYYSEQDFKTLNDWMLMDFAKEGIDVSKVYYCPHLPDATVEQYRMECLCRKPALGMYERAMQEFDIDMKSSFAVGDKIRDCAVCEVYGCKGFLVGNNEKEEVVNAVICGEYKNVKYAEDLYHAANKIIQSRVEE